MTDPDQGLQDALDVLDAVFAPVSGRPFTVGGCTHCYGQSDLDSLGGPVDRIPEDLIAAVATEVTDHWDDFPGLYHRLTPWIVRLLATGRLHVDHGLIASRLLAADCRNWAPAEQETLEQVWDAWWRSALHEYPGTDPIISVLEMISVCTGTLRPWLDIWAETRTEAADQHLRDAVRRWLLMRDLADLHLGFYDELHATPELLPWLRNTAGGRIDAAQFSEVKRIMNRSVS
ncbi:MAG TPA: hypothetical protein VHY58_20725 [Streptosporangiaceae bacterium]|jgi:hypothetical protein|nr:hypothetical protein [Streptosporangiaceae bacterium]